MLTDERLRELWTHHGQVGTDYRGWCRTFARAVEAEALEAAARSAAGRDRDHLARIERLRCFIAAQADNVEQETAWNELNSLSAERDQLIADARRYRWLNDARRSHIQEWMECDTEREANAYIDAALAKEGKA